MVRGQKISVLAPDQAEFFKRICLFSPFRGTTGQIFGINDLAAVELRETLVNNGVEASKRCADSDLATMPIMAKRRVVAIAVDGHSGKTNFIPVD